MSVDINQGAALADRSSGRRASDRIVGASAVTEQLREQASTAARSELPVLITGPSGAGKQHLARAIHAWSARASEDLIVYQARAIPTALQVRELLGAPESGDPLLSGGHRGALERVGKGTLLLSGIERMSSAAREALVQALRTGHFQREGQGPSTPVQARVIATADAGDGSLFGDVPVQTLSVTALASRSEDILPLAAHLLALHAETESITPVGFTSDARRCLVDEPWPGNVRELSERIRQALRLAGEGAVSVEALLLSVDGDDVPSFKEAKRGFETRYVKGLLRRCGGNISRAARLAKKDRKDFYDVIRRTGVDPQEFRP